MAKNTLTNKLEKIIFRYSDFITEDGREMFCDEIKEIIELSKKYKKVD
jgi:hypothetical protein